MCQSGEVWGRLDTKGMEADVPAHARVWDTAIGHRGGHLFHVRFCTVRRPIRRDTLTAPAAQVPAVDVLETNLPDPLLTLPTWSRPVVAGFAFDKRMSKPADVELARCNICTMGQSRD